MEQTKVNKMAVEPIKKLFWKMGLPMIISMVLQALYNVVDSIFVANMEGSGALANQALTIAFPVQIMIIAIGVGTGVGLNALLSKNLGQQNKEEVSAVVGNGIFLALVIYAVFLLFGLFLSEWFIGLFSDNSDVVSMGSSYLKICVCFSLGSIGFAIYIVLPVACKKRSYMAKPIVPENMRLFFSRLDRLCHIRTLFAGDRQNDVFHDCADFRRGCQYRTGLRFHFSARYGRRRRGMGYDYRAIYFLVYRDDSALLQK